MSPSFDFFFSFFGLLLGLSAVEVASGLASAVARRDRIRIGYLSPLLAIFVLFDIASFWLFTWNARELIRINADNVALGLTIAVTYYLAAALVFPRSDDVINLDDHYWQQKRLIIGGLIAVNAVVMGLAIAYGSQEIKGGLWLVFQLLYWLPMVGLLVSRNRIVDAVLLVTLIVNYAV